MSARALSLLVCAIAACGSPAGGVRADTGLAGHWRGAIVRHNAVQTISVNLHDAGGDVDGTYDVPDLSLYDEPLREVSVDDSTVTFRILYGPFTLRRHLHLDELTGGNGRWNPPLALHLKRAAAAPPPWYATESITVQVNGAVRLGATLYTPRSAGPFPAVVVIPGSGAQSRADWHLRSHAYALARSGVACLVYDKRGTGTSTGSWEQATFADLARDASAAVGALRGRAGIRDDAIGLMGISQGGWIAAIAAHRAPSPDFVVFMEGPARSLHDQDIDRVRYQMTADGFSTGAVDSAVAHTRLFFDVVAGASPWPDLERSTAAARASAWAEYVSLPANADDDMQWWRDAAYDPAADLRTLEVPPW